jgi:hypothetical protein
MKLRNKDKEMYLLLCGWHLSQHYTWKRSMYKWVHESTPKSLPLTLDQAFTMQREDDGLCEN